MSKKNYELLYCYYLFEFVFLLIMFLHLKNNNVIVENGKQLNFGVVRFTLVEIRSSVQRIVECDLVEF